MYSDSYLQQLWRKAVKKYRGDRCAICYKTPVEIHHIVKRRNAILRHDYRNGIPLCKDCHNKAHTIELTNDIYSLINDDIDYLMGKEAWLFKDYLVKNGMTKKEFLEEKVKELKGVIGGL